MVFYKCENNFYLVSKSPYSPIGLHSVMHLLFFKNSGDEQLRQSLFGPYGSHVLQFGSQASQVWVLPLPQNPGLHDGLHSFSSK